MKQISIGQVVFSKMGRDKGKFFLVVRLDKNFAEIADGDIRKVEKPKKKKLIHLKLTDTVLYNLQEKITAGKVIHNKELISALKAFNANGEGEQNVER